VVVVTLIIVFDEQAVTAQALTQQLPHESVQQVTVVHDVLAQGWAVHAVPPAAQLVAAHGCTEHPVSLVAVEPALPESTTSGEQAGTPARPPATKLPRMRASSVFTCSSSWWWRRCCR
jgi:hypothetical protein